MSRDSSGNYSLPAGNPVVSNTQITATWGNTTCQDIATALTDSLSRSGKGGMTSPLQSVDGSMANPQYTWTSEPTSGWYRKSAGVHYYSILGVDVFGLNASGLLVPNTTANQIQVSNGSGALVFTDYYKDPINVNPNFVFDQKNGGAAVTALVGSTVQGPDGWTAGTIAGTGEYTIQQVADPDFNSLLCMKISCTVADAAIAVGDSYAIFTTVEGYDAAAFGFGISANQDITIQFKFKTSVTGVYGVSIRNSASDRSYVQIITVVDTDEHNYILTFPSDSTGTWLYTTGSGLHFSICLAAGSTYQATAGAWTAGNKITTSAQCNFMSSNTNVAYLKRVHIIPGDVGCAYKPIDASAELSKCERYFQKFAPSGYLATGAALDANTAYVPIQLRKRMRVAPTVTIPATAGSGVTEATFANSSGNYPAVFGSNAVLSSTPEVFVISGTGYTGMFVGGDQSLFVVGASAALYANARLS